MSAHVSKIAKSPIIDDKKCVMPMPIPMPGPNHQFIIESLKSQHQIDADKS